MKFIYHIEGMHCAACVEKIKTALSQTNQVISVTLTPPRLTIESEQPPSLTLLNQQIAAAGNYQLKSETTQKPEQSYNNTPTEKTGLFAYYPIFLIAAYITGVATLNNLHDGQMNWMPWMNQFMAGFFLVFSAFKLLDLHGFAEGYATYDLLAQRWYGYGYVYPFLELALGIAYLLPAFDGSKQIATIILMGFSSLGVINSLLKRRQIQCACLGTMLKVPLSNITLIEDLLMVVMAAITLVKAY
jgi:copper chaperone CopZ